MIEQISERTLNIASEIAAERLRQVTVEGYSEAHDDNHDDGELAFAAASYAWPGTTTIKTGNGSFDCDDLWPWDADEFKKFEKDRRRQLIIAAAFIVAEIDRLDRNPMDDRSSVEQNATGTAESDV
jgi:hypothetical protein